MASIGRGARVKGHQFERDMAKYLSQRTGYKFKRGLGQTRQGGVEVSDVFSPDCPELHFECKRQKKCSIPAAFMQASLDCRKTSKMPIVITKSDRDETLVTMRLQDWTLLLETYLNTKSPPDDKPDLSAVPEIMEDASEESLSE